MSGLNVFNIDYKKHKECLQVQDEVKILYIPLYIYIYIYIYYFLQ